MIPGIEESGKGYEEHIASKVGSEYKTPITFEENSLSQAVLDFWRKAGYLYFDEKSVRYLARTDLVSWLNEKINPKNSTGSNVEISVSEKQLAALFSDAGIWVEFLQKFYFDPTALPQLVKNQTLEATGDTILRDTLQKSIQTLWNEITGQMSISNKTDVLERIKRVINDDPTLQNLAWQAINNLETNKNPSLEELKTKILASLGLSQTIAEPAS